MAFSKSLERKVQYSIELLRKAEQFALSLDPQNGYYLAFSGGKDSQALYHIAKLAGVRFKAHMNLTSIDPPEVIRFVKREYPDVELIAPTKSIYQHAIKKRILPTMRMRWCCALYKETSGAGTITLIGIRHEESTKRSKRKEFEVSGHKFSGNFDQWSEHQEKMVTCVSGKDKYLISPIIDWTTHDVWEFLNKSGIPHCELYDKGYTRIGCICCPMSCMKQKRKEIAAYPHVKRNWLRVIQWFIDNGYANYAVQYNLSPSEVFEWWISGLNFQTWYADNYKQLKLDLL